jgi:hypothetical protein
MKNIKLYKGLQYCLIAAAAMVLSCEEDSSMDYKGGDELGVTDSYLQITTPVVGFQAGTEQYSIAFNAINGEKDIEKVNIYSTFTDTDGSTSNEGLFASYDVEGPLLNKIEDDFTYDDLRAGLTINGGPLTDDQNQLAVGAGWKFRFEGVRPNGDIVRLPGNINVAVLSRFAGIYKFTKIEYYRIGVLRNDVSDPIIGTELFIGSVDENTFSHNDWWGPFAWSGCSFNFDIDFEDGNKATVPVLTSCGLFSGTEAVSCPNLAFGKCATSNVLIVDDVTGKHKLKLSYGYVGAGGNREFYTELEKVVD